MRQKWNHEKHLRWRIAQNARAVLSLAGTGTEHMYGYERMIEEIKKDIKELEELEQTAKT